MTNKELLQQALDALERGETQLRYEAIAALTAALAEPEQDPVAWMIVGVVEDVERTVFVGHNAVGDYRHLWGNAESVPLYTTPRKPLKEKNT